MTVACVIVNFNGYRHTLRAVESLQAQSLRPDLIIVVDNGSTVDETGFFSNQASESLVVLRSPANLGFAGGCNLGIRYALERGCRFVLILNNDIWAERDALASLVRGLESNTDSVACPLIVRMDDPEVVWAAGGELNLRTGGPRHHLQGAQRRAAGPGKRVSFASGCALLVRSEVFRDVGLLPERWFLYFEDTEFCAQLARAGRTIRFVPEAVIQHLAGGSVARSDVAYFFYWRNYLLFIREWMRGPGRLFALSRVVATMAAIATFNLLVGRPHRARMMLTAATSALRQDWAITSVLGRLG